MWNKFNTFLLISLLTHTTVIFYDTIKLNLNFEFNLKEQKNIEQVKSNTLAVKKSNHAPQQKEMLEEYFKEEITRIEEAAKERFIKENMALKPKTPSAGESAIKVKLDGSGQYSGSGQESDLAKMMQKTFPQGGGNFQSALEEKLVPAETKPMSSKVVFLGRQEKKEIFSEACEGGTKYVGLGFAIEAPQLNPLGNNFTYQNKIPWQINKLAPGHIADRTQMREGDVFLGVINKEGKFFEGNTFLGENYQKGTWVKVLWRQGKALIKKDVQLEEICYYPDKNSYIKP